MVGVMTVGAIFCLLFDTGISLSNLRRRTTAYAWEASQKATRAAVNNGLLFIELLRKMFGPEHEGARLMVKSLALW
jgi:hypothetical protein